jgi:ParB family chromosome partitioning protein
MPTGLNLAPKAMEVAITLLSHSSPSPMWNSDSIGKLFAAYLRRVEESALGDLLVEITILHSAMRQNAAQVLRDAATAYKVDVDAIGLKVKQEFAAKEKTRLGKKPPTKATAKAQPKPTKKAKAA